jgi:hypothetical protein
MAMTKVQQELWAQTMVSLFETDLWASRVCNTSLIQGTGLNADKWHITAGSAVTTANVSDAADLTYSETTDTVTEVTVNFDKSFSLINYDTVKSEAAMNYFPIYARRGAYQLMDDLDTDILLDSFTNAGTVFDNGGTDWQFTKATCAEIPAFFGKLSKTAKDNDWPSNMEKYAIVPSGMLEAIITYTGGKDSAFGDSVLTQGLSNAFVYAGWNIFVSNNCNNDGSTLHGVAGLVGDGIALGMQIDPSSIESMRSEGRFGDLIRGRMKAGHKVYRSSAVIDIEFNPTVVATA